jgi:hypothetical protein
VTSRRERSRTVLALGAAVVILPGIWCPSALAGTATVEHHVDYEVGGPHGETYEYISDTITYRAASGEQNDVKLTARDRSATIHDNGAAVVAGRGCDQVTPHEAHCSGGTDGAVFATAYLGDGDDAAHLIGSPGADGTLGAYGALAAKGGPGNDTLIGASSKPYLDGGPGNDSLDAKSASSGSSMLGGPGDDTLVGGPGGDDATGGAGSDRLFGGPGDDTLQGDGSGATPASDHLDGGTGAFDTVQYIERSSGVNVDLERPEGNGQAGENDHIVGVEDAVGGGGSDRIAGDEGPNDLRGAAGYAGGSPVVHGARDVLIGRGGNDFLEVDSADGLLDGGSGDDTLDGYVGYRVDYRGGRGNDDISLSGVGPPARISCGSGVDWLHFVRLRDIVPSDCDDVQLSRNADFLVSTRIVRVDTESGAVHLTVFSNEEGFCRAEIRLFALRGSHRRVLGEGDIPIHKIHRKQRVRLALTALGRRLLVPEHELPVQVEADGLVNCRPRWNELGKPYPDFTVMARVGR